MASGFVQSNGAQIYYEVHGAATSGAAAPLVFLHGNGEDSRYFAPQVAHFAERYKVVTIDSRAHGQSTRGNGALSFAAMAGDVLATLNHLSIDRAAVVGFSDGGNAALHVALAAPERVQALVIIGANLFPRGMKAGAHLFITAGYAWRCLKGIFSKAARAARERWALMVFHPRLTADAISAIHAPTLVVAGEHDVIRESHTRLIASAIPAATLKIIPRADHFLTSKKPDVFNAIVEKFLTQL
ncbi:MAG: alpha/beta hydrolase [Prevotellaceae bacterium]|jgi:pimeloyl-ACP methyl ester carboxylesterase|nr:alpha/beta hydrolase [Prevotellaceae bacterium]